MRLWVAVLILLAGRSVVAAPPPLEKTPEFRFAKGLADLGYPDLAAERFLLLKKGLKPPDPNYFRVALALVEAYAGAAAQARKPQDQLDLSARAVAELEGLIQAQTDPDQRNLLRYRLGKQLLERGRLITEILSRKPGDLDAATLRDTARKALERAMATLQEVAAAQGKIVQAIEEKAKKGLSNADRRRRAFAAEQQLIAETEIGWTHFRLAKLWAEAGDAAARKTALENAVKVFAKVSQAHPDTVAGIFSMLGRGQALEELGQLDPALEAYRGVLEVSRDETVAPLQQYALLYRARVLRKQGKFPEAVASLEALETLARKMPRSRVVTAEVVRLEHAKTLGAYGDALRAEAAQLEKKDPARARLRTEESRRAYREAVERIEPLTRPGSLHSAEAYRLMGRWLAHAGPGGERTAKQWFAEGETLFNGGKVLEAVAAYRRAIALSGPADEVLRRNAWVRMGVAYARAARTDPRYYYHSGLVLGHLARLYPDAPIAEKAAVHSAALLGANYARKDRTPFDTDTYLEAQHYLIEKYPTHPAALRAAYRVAGQLRNRGEFLKAAEAFENVQESSPFYEAAQYAAGDAYWTAYLQRRARAKVPDAALRGRAVARLTAFLRWADEAPVAAASAEARRLYTGRARTLLAEIYLHEDVHKPREALRLLQGFETRYAAHPALIAPALFLRVRAHCAAGDLEAAEADLDRLLAHKDYRNNALACRIVGSAYVDRARRLKGSGGAAARIAQANEKAGRYLNRSLQIRKDQPLEEYTLIARLLYQAEAYAGARDAFAAIIERFEGKSGSEGVVWSAREWRAMCQMKTGEWDQAVAGFKEVIKRFPRVMKLRRNLAVSLEHLDTPDALRQAVAEWRLVLRTSKRGAPDWFEATYSLARDYARLGKKDTAYELVATAAIAYPDLGGAEWRAKFERLVAERLPEYREKFQRLRAETAPKR